MLMQNLDEAFVRQLPFHPKCERKIKIPQSPVSVTISYLTKVITWFTKLPTKTHRPHAGLM